MCMIVERPFPETGGTGLEKEAKSDIPCWKIVEYVTDRDGGTVAVTPYKFARVDEAALEGALPYEARGEKHVTQGGSGTAQYFIVDGGYVHSFAKPDDAMTGDLMFLLRTIGDREDCLDGTARAKAYALYRCVIPKGAAYIEGHADGRVDSPNYASERVVYKKRVAYWDRWDPDDAEAIESGVRAVVEREAAEAETGKEDWPCA